MNVQPVLAFVIVENSSNPKAESRIATDFPYNHFACVTSPYHHNLLFDYMLSLQQKDNYLFPHEPQPYAKAPYQEDAH